MQRTITFIAEDKKREYQGMKTASEDNASPPHHSQVLPIEMPDNTLETV